MTILDLLLPPRLSTLTQDPLTIVRRLSTLIPIHISNKRSSILRTWHSRTLRLHLPLALYQRSIPMDRHPL